MRLQVVLGSFVLLITLIVLLVVGCKEGKMKAEDRERRESAARVWAGFVEGVVVECSHPKSKADTSSCSVQTGQKGSGACRYLIFCEAGACKQMDSTCKATP